MTRRQNPYAVSGIGTSTNAWLYDCSSDLERGHEWDKATRTGRQVAGWHGLTDEAGERYRRAHHLAEKKYLPAIREETDRILVEEFGEKP